MAGNKYKEMDKMKYFAVLLLTIIIFASGILLGNYISGEKAEQLNEVQENIKLRTLGAETQFQLMTMDPCQFINSTPLTQDLYELSEKLDHLETLMGKDSDQVKRLKERYSILEIRHWLYTKKTNEECGTNHTPILYFYSNQGDCAKCEEQGYVLTYLRRKYPNLRVYSFDIHMENPALNTVKDIYDVRQPPTLIVGSRVYREFQTRNDMEKILGKV